MDNLKKFYTLEIAKLSSENQFNLDNINNKLNIGKKNIFLKIISNKGIYLNENLKLIFQNKYQLDKLKILDNYKNCYLIKNDWNIWYNFTICNFLSIFAFPI